MGTDFNAKKATFRDRFAKSRENAAKPWGGDDIPPSVYFGKVKTYERGVSKNGRNQTKLELVIVDGDQKGLVARQFQGLDPLDDGRDIGLDITLRTISFFGYELPESATELKDLDPILQAIEDEAPTVQFKYTMKGDFPNIELQKLIESEKAEGEGAGAETVDGGTETEAQAAAKSSAGFEDSDHEKLVQFALEQGVDGVTDGMSKAEVAACFDGYTFWTNDCAAGDLKGTDAEGSEPNDGIDVDTAKWLEECGVKSTNIVRPKPKAKAAPAKAAAAPAKKAAPAPAAKKRK